MKNLALPLIGFLLCTFPHFLCAQGSNTYSLRSPDGRTEVKIAAGSSLTYTLHFREKTILSPSLLDIHIDSLHLGQAPQVQRTRTRSVREKLPVPIPTKTDTLAEVFNELRLEMKGGYSLVFRAYDQGVAYRWESAWKKEKVTVFAETVDYQFPEDVKLYFPRERGFFSHQEPAFEHLAAKELNPLSLASLPVLIQYSTGPTLFIAESDIEDYPGLWIKGTGNNALSGTHPPYPLKVRLSQDRNLRVEESAGFIAQTKGTRTYPWRILGIAQTDADLLQNQLVYLLAKPNALGDISWIRPGKVAWDWWNANNIYGVDFVSGINTATYKHYIDFAARHGLEYIILDEGYYELGDVLKIKPDIDMDILSDYAKAKKVGLILWVVWNTLEEKLEEALAQYEKWGIKGIKVDFMQRDDQILMNYYHHLSQLAARHRLLVDFHGSNRPILLARTYPNLITTEGIRGLEWSKWSDSIHPDHNLIIPFTRMLLGPMDYTPGAMINVKKENFRAVFDQPMSLGTRCHQLGMYVIYESPLQMLADNPSNYEREPECMEFLSKVPVTWDETRVLHAKIGETIVLARRKGRDWYLGAMNNWTAREWNLDLSFLPEGTFQLDEWADGPNASRHGSDFSRNTRQITRQSALTLRLASGGGYAAVIRAKNP